MDLLTRNDFNSLLDNRDELCVSIYIPTHRSAPETGQDPIRFKNMLQQAGHEVKQCGLQPAEIHDLFASAEGWLEDVDFWRHQSDGLAVFLTPSAHRRFRLPHRFDEQLRVGDHSYVNPLLPLLQSNGTFYLLAVSQNTCRLFVGNRDAIQELSEADLPDDLRSALGWWRENELQLHSMQRKPQSRGGDDTAVYHGHFEDTTKDELQAYFRRINAGVTDVLRGEQAPLVFAGVEYLLPIYADVNTYAGLCDTPVIGNPDDESGAELHWQAWEIVQPHFERRQRQALEEYGWRSAQGTATSDVPLILRAARDGLVETLVVPQQAKLCGTFDEETGQVVLLDSDSNQTADDLLDRAVLLTFKSSGDVFAIDPTAMPNQSNLLALLRAPVAAVAS